MMKYLVAIALIFALLAGGLFVQTLYRRFAARHPDLGPFRKEEGCGSCSAGSGCASCCAPSCRD